MSRYRFGLIVTGEGEERYITRLFRSLQSAYPCHFEVLRRVGQRSPRTQSHPSPNVTGTRKRIPNKDEEEIGLAALAYMRQYPFAFVIVLDDLEWDRRNDADRVFRRYRDAMDAVLVPCKLSHAGSVHFFVMMLEAYYLACPDVLHATLGVDFPQLDGDVEAVRSPIGAIKDRYPGFDKIEHGSTIVAKLDVPAILSDPNSCASLRTLFAWCVKAMGGRFGEMYRLGDGRLFSATQHQIGVVGGGTDA